MATPISAALQEARTAFAQAWEPPLAARLARDLLSELLDVSPAWIASHANDPLPASALRRLRRLLPRAARGEPLAHLTGQAIFTGRPFAVTPTTLIPRVETEELVGLVLARYPRTDRSACLLDIGCGSGCIGLTLAAERPGTPVILSDTSAKALAVARKNASRLLGSGVRTLSFSRASLFAPSLRRHPRVRRARHLVIAANLPYLPDADRRTLQPSVRRFEPAGALFGGARGDELIKTLATQIIGYKNAHPEVSVDLFLEIDPDYAESLQAWLSERLPNHAVAVREDGFGRARFLAVTESPRPARRTPGRRS